MIIISMFAKLSLQKGLKQNKSKKDKQDDHINGHAKLLLITSNVTLINTKCGQLWYLQYVLL